MVEKMQFRNTSWYGTVRGSCFAILPGSERDLSGTIQVKGIYHDWSTVWPIIKKDISLYTGNKILPSYIPGFHAPWKQWIPEPVRMTHGMSGFCSRSRGLAKQTEAKFTNIINGILATPAQESGVNKALFKETWWLINTDRTLVVGTQ